MGSAVKAAVSKFCIKGQFPTMDEETIESSTNVSVTLKNFYDEFGWQMDDSGESLNNFSYFHDTDESATRYRIDRELRYKSVYSGGGKYFLEVGCGGEPKPVFSEDFDVHLCLDISLVGLKTARSQLGESGAYVLADLSYLPFKENVIDGLLASHCLYHVHKDQQKKVLWEFYRVTKDRKFILVFYSSRYNLISLLHKFAYTGFRIGNVLLHGLGLHLGTLPPYLQVRFRKRGTVEDGTVKKSVPNLYSFAHNPVSLVREFRSADVSCLMSLSIYDTKLLKKLRLLGVTVLGLNFLEKRFPHAMRYVGKFTCIKIQKQV
jgi:SAM-dependent methyltransferase